MSTPAHRSNGDEREDTAAAIGVAVAAVYSAAEIAIIQAIADLAKKTVTGRLIPGIAGRRVQAITLHLMNQAHTEAARVLRDRMTQVAARVRALVARDLAHLPPATVAAATDNTVPMPPLSSGAVGDTTPLTGMLRQAEYTAMVNADTAFGEATTPPAEGISSTTTAALTGPPQRLALPAGQPPTPPQPPGGPAWRTPWREGDDAYRRAVQGAVEDTRGGLPANSLSLSRIQAAQKALDELAEHGITGFTDRAGRNWDLASYVEMATRTAVSAAWDNLQAGALFRAGLDLVIVGTHSTEGSCAHCAPFLGKVLSLTGGVTGDVAVVDETGTVHHAEVFATLDDARAAGFRHPNCRCDLIPYLDGMNMAQLGWFAVPEAETEAVYKASQQQRALERRVRAAARRHAAAITPAARARARRDLAAATLAAEAYRKATNLRITKVSAARREHPFHAH